MPQEQFDITVVAPDDTPSSLSMVPVFKLETADLEAFLNSPVNSPDLISHDGKSSGGYSTPNTPFNPLLDCYALEDYNQSSLIATPNSPYSPTGLNSSLLSLSLGNDGSSNSNDLYGPHDKDVMFTAPEYPTLNDIFFTQAIDPTRSPSRTSLSPLIIPQGSPSDMNAADGSWNGSAEVDDYWTHMLQLDGLEATPPLSLDPEIQGASQNLYQLPTPDTLSNAPSFQRIQRPSSPHHIRHTSEVNTPWTGSSNSSAHRNSPSVTLTPSEPATSLLEAPSSFQDLHEHFKASSGATVQRRHSHSGNRAGSSTDVGPGPDRGRSDAKAPTSASSSRRSSPYPSPRPSVSPISPNQVYESGNHLAVPPAGGLVDLRRRHSFTYGRSMTYGNAAMLHTDVQPMTMFNYHDPVASAPPTRRVASQAGIKASEARRTKEAKFVCDLCGQTFTTNHNLKNHVNVHLGVKEHQCSGCNRNFTTQSVLARHTKTCKASESSHRRHPSSNP